MSEKLERAILYEAEKLKNKEMQDSKPSFHACAPVGWINDPNGFSFYQGKYHLFYQYHPYDTHWGPMHWGHSRTSDFIKWEQLPCALAPDTQYDGQGCFSGTAIEHDGKHVLMYTGVLEQLSEDGKRLVRQAQCIAIGDGVHYDKLECNPVITGDMLPEGSSPEDFRDPKLWKEGNTFYALIGSKGGDGSSQIVLFSSENLKVWKFEKIVDRCLDTYGKMWECPDFFSLDGKQLLIVSPQFMRAQGMEFHNGNNSIYFVGEYDRETKEFTRGCPYQIDYGMDFYAPQTTAAGEGRRILIGWLQSWDNYLTPDDAQWSGMMTIPREISLKDGKLFQTPVRELDLYHKNEVKYSHVQIAEENGSLSLDRIFGRCLDMTIEVEKGVYDDFTVLLAADEQYETALIWNRREKTFTTDRTYCGLTKDLLTRRSMQLENTDEKIKLRIVMDKYSIEVFVNDGQKVMTSLIYTPLKAQQILFRATGSLTFSVTKFDVEVN